ncbi:MAG: outer membrane homotrimeric porin [Desulfovibrio sp.]|jgi:hypothetical protein|nr:outer membrane homotrimeric porin [Desulfovibrio sp.]
MNSTLAFKAKGEWVMNFDYGQNGVFTGGNGRTGYGSGQDEFEALQRVRLQFDAVASEALSANVFFEIGNQTWGSGGQTTNSGGALGSDSQNAIELRRAYIDWMVPQTDLQIRMGIQGMAFPSFTMKESMVFEDDVAGITLNYKVNDNVSLTALWARPWNDNFTRAGAAREIGGANAMRTNPFSSSTNYMDNVDAFALLVPLSFDGVKVTPWAMYAAVGPNAFRTEAFTGRNEKGETKNEWDYDNVGNIAGNASSKVAAGMVPVNGSRHKDGSDASKRLNSYADAWWAGLTGEVTVLDPFRIAWDFNYGSVRWDDSRLNRQGWLASLLFEYKLDWGIPGIFGWYASGDDSNPANGSERMPSIDPNGNNDYSSFSFNGQPWIGREGVLSTNMTGTWGIGARLKNVSFVEDLKHTLRLIYMGGTNSPGMAKYFNGKRDNWGDYEDALGNHVANGGPNSGLPGMGPLYMTTQDSALEIGLTNVYQMYENFQIYLEGTYLATWLDHSKGVWGRSTLNGKSDQERDPWNINLSFVYSF